MTIKLNTQHKALIIEDTAELAEILRITMTNMGIETFTAFHGRKAIDFIQTHRPDLILLDIGLPDMSGWKVLETLEQLDIALPKIVVISAFSDPANRLVGKLQGVNSYLIKPFTTQEVEAVVQKVLQTE
ncbi:MAG: response regulator transcription factor [Phototrophicaceae bacterium]